MIASGEPPQKDQFARLLEHVTAAAVARILGGEGIRFGVPREPSLGTTFSEALEWLARHVGGRVQAGAADADQSGDGGVDAIGWRGFADARHNSLVALAQSSGGKDWREKAIDIPSWQTNYFAFSVIPIAVLLFPGTLDAVSDRDLYSLNLGLVLDRVRTAACVSDELLDEQVLRQIREWNTVVEHQLPRDQ